MTARLLEGFRFRHSIDRLTLRRIARYHYGLDLLRAWQGCLHTMSSVGRWIRIRSRVGAFLGRVRSFASRQFNGAGSGPAGPIFIASLIGIVTFKIARHHLPSPTIVPADAVVVTSTPPIIVGNVEAPVVLASVPEEVEQPLDEPVSAAPAAPRPAVAFDPASRVKLDYALARERALARLRETDPYVEALRELNQAESRVLALRSDLTNKDLPEASVRWMRAKSVITGMERAVLKADPEVQRTESAMRAGGYIQPTFPIRSSDRVDELDTPSNQTAATN